MGLTLPQGFCSFGPKPLETQMNPLTGKQNAHLRALGHHLKPLLQLGKAGLSPEFLRKTAAALEQHELIKVKLLQNCPLGKDEAAQEITKALDCALAQSIGKTLLLYKPNPKEPVIVLPK